MTDLVLRNAALGDADVLGALHVASWKETYAGIVPDSMLDRLSVDERTRMWADLLADPYHSKSGGVVVVEDEDEDEDEGSAIGFGSCGMQRGKVPGTAGFRGEFNAAYVLRSRQARGAGGSIMQAMAKNLAARGHGLLLYGC